MSRRGFIGALYRHHDLLRTIVSSTKGIVRVNSSSHPHSESLLAMFYRLWAIVSRRDGLCSLPRQHNARRWRGFLSDARHCKRRPRQRRSRLGRIEVCAFGHLGRVLCWDGVLQKPSPMRIQNLIVNVSVVVVEKPTEIVQKWMPSVYRRPTLRFVSVQQYLSSVYLF